VATGVDFGADAAAAPDPALVTDVRLPGLLDTPF